MLKIFLIFLAFIVFFVLILRLAVILMGKIAGRYVNDKHKAAEEIVNTGKVPKEWSDKLEKRISLVSDSHQSKKVLKMEKRAKTTILKRIDNLIKYFKTSPLIRDRQTKKILLDKLLKARKDWEKKSYKEII